MQTVKYVSPEGNELVIEALRVRAYKLSSADRHPFKVVVVEPNGHSEVFEDGTVYVMNDAGSTTSQWMVNKNN